ncbi:hypothetical protein [Marinobacter lipolyticus]|uniref:transporter substrate-binding domain-containing protein n=1 Tax=Marinobacter lipolyticus TaxID=209639 RepID=UPI001BD0FE4B|nr:hypothetical protein [Marinobacter lipolyticus]
MQGLLKPLYTAALLLAAWPTAADLHLYTFNAPPYQIVESDSALGTIVRGETVDTVVCSAGLAGSVVIIKAAPQNRSVHSLRRNLIDGYFAIDSSDELDKVGTRTAPIALEKWYFFSAEQGVDPHTARIGVVSGSNEELWLKNNGYDVFLSVSNVEQLNALLRRGRIDTALLDSRVMETLNSGAAQLTLHRQFLRYAPLHMYFSEAFAANHAEFVADFNRFIPDCVESGFALNPHETELIGGQAKLLFDDLRSRLNLREAIRLGPRVDSFADILTLDTKWQALSPQAAPALAEDILRLTASEQLAAWQARQEGLVTEAMVINNLGTLVAMSRLTSDYWQGDEPKFQQMADGSGRTLYLSPIRYDTSTRRFQVIASTPILSAETGKLEGVLAVGLDVEEALSRLDRN